VISRKFREVTTSRDFLAPGPTPGSREGLPLPRPLRTGRESFPSPGSSLASAPCGTRFRDLRRLHDACLEPAHVLVDGTPVNGVPAVGFVGNRTNRFGWGCRHLLCFLCRFAKLCRDARPVGSQRAFTPGMSHPVSARLPGGFRIFRPPSPAPPWVGLAAFLPADAGAIRASHVPLE
jgi:hypothetical protein